MALFRNGVQFAALRAMQRLIKRSADVSVMRGQAPGAHSPGGQ
jgi:hypothetical protein